MRGPCPGHVTQLRVGITEMGQIGENLDPQRVWGQVRREAPEIKWM